MISRLGYILIIFVINMVLFSDISYAQTTPTANETQVGDACKNAAHSTDFDTLVQCNSTGASGTMQKAPLFVGAVTSPPYTATTCDAGKKGMMQYDGSNMQYCDGSVWQVMPTKSYVDAASGGTWHSQEFTASGTWTKPAGVTEVNVLLVGGGGAGNVGWSSSSFSSSGGGGGGGGGFSAIQNLPVSSNLTVTIGAGGISSGGDGGTTSITGGAFSVYAKGGKGGIGEYNRGFGGIGGAGTSALGENGQFGTGAYNLSDSAMGGRGGDSVYGSGGIGGARATAGENASGYGGGGGGGGVSGSNTFGAGNGTSGYAIIYWQE